MNNYTERSIDFNVIPKSFDLSIYIELVNKIIVKRIKQTKTNVGLSWDPTNIPLIYLVSVNGDNELDRKNKTPYLRYNLILPERKLLANWNTTDNNSVEEFEKELYYLRLPFNNRFGVYSKDNVFVKYIHIKFNYDKIILYKNNEPKNINYRLSGINNVVIEIDDIIKCVKCGEEIFGKYEACEDCEK